MFSQYVCEIILWQSYSESICGHWKPPSERKKQTYGPQDGASNSTLRARSTSPFWRKWPRSALWKLEGICLCNTLFNKNKFLPAIPPKHDIWYSFHLATSSLTSHLNQASTWQYPHPSHHPIIPSRYWCTNVKRVMSWSIWASLAISRWSTLSTCSNCAWTWSSSGVGADSLVVETKLGAAPERGKHEWSSNQRGADMWKPKQFQIEWLWILQTFGICHLYSRSFRPMGNQTPLFRSWCRMLGRTDWDKALSLPVQVLVLATKDKGDIQRKWHSNNRRHRDVSVH